jgi:hypothetical protein
MYSTQTRKKYAELLKTATDKLAELYGVDVSSDKDPPKESKKK